ncbi:hypothetical protein Srot_0225 [Segniliparus rotundus DSM 44985]|uniref:Uncharacterized protein n=1 Tax=Segniliparus rotundus (strain ATCC BAA-972 / CDC 1076 / CIP 108378 / DSM 44985 / JCM 13578) TaxID=640132 RepID=D6ZAH0_SEGRD|nr:hypothetical protein [Segniliparus rotundus]ADG96712.1 hypothetical protein Srot_0225 [Segniliparus rotundus DSM 44985]
MQPADVLYNMAQSALKRNEQTFQAFQKSMAQRKAQQEALYAQVKEKNTAEPTAEELKAEKGERKAASIWNDTGKFGNLESEESVSEEPVKRDVRADADTRSFRPVDEDEEAEDAPVGRHSRPDDGIWGASTRKIGSYQDEEE